MVSGCSNERLRGTVFYISPPPRIEVTVNGYKGDNIEPLKGIKIGEDTGKQKEKSMLLEDEEVKRLREEFPSVESGNYYQIPSVDVSGNWSGLWRSGNGVAKGNLSMSLAQNESGLSGTVIIIDSPCFSAGNITGMVIKNNITSAIFSGGLRIDFNGTLVDNNMDGSYVVINGGACTGDSGTWKVSK